MSEYLHAPHGKSEKVPEGAKDSLHAGQAGARRVVQIPLDLPVETQFGRDDFLVSPSNEEAWGWIEKWPQWPADQLVIIGPEGSGKSHLGTIWAEKARAVTVSADKLTPEMVPEIAGSGAVWIDNAGSGQFSERALFHLINLLRERAGHLLLTAGKAPAYWNIHTPDLLSRLRLAPAVEIGAPDETLIRAVLVKLFFDRQLDVDAPVVEYIATRIERSMAAVRQMVEILDREALSRHRAITRPMVADVLKRYEND